jgi:hypothetical protein
MEEQVAQIMDEVVTSIEFEQVAPHNIKTIETS